MCMFLFGLVLMFLIIFSLVMGCCNLGLIILFSVVCIVVFRLLL